MVGKRKKKVPGARLWMKFDRFGNSELIEFDKSTIIKRVAIPSRDLRLLGSFSSNTSHILARENAMVVHLEFIRAIVTADEVLVLDPLRTEVIPFVDELIRKQVAHNKKPPSNIHTDSSEDDVNVLIPCPENVSGWESDLPFEFQVLEIILELICTHFNTSVTELEKDAYPSLDELVKNVNNDNLQHILTLKSNLTLLLARVQKVRDEIEHMLDDDEDMANLYLTRKLIQVQELEAMFGGARRSNRTTTINAQAPYLRRLGSKMSASFWDDNHQHIEDLEMIFEAYFVQLEGTRKKLLSVREHINMAEDVVNIQLDNRRNELIQLQLMLKSSVISISLQFAISGALSMNIPCVLYEMHGIFGHAVLGIVIVGFSSFMFILRFAKWKNLL